MIDLNPATLGLTDGQPWAGDATWTVTGGAPVGQGGRLVFEGGATPDVIEAAGTSPAEWTLHLVAGFTPGTSPAPGVGWGPWLLCTTDGRWALDTMQTDPLTGVHVITATGDATTTTLYVDGVQVGTGGPTPAGGTVELSAYAGSGHVLTVARMILEDSIPATLSADMASLVDQYVTGLQAAGGWGYEATATVAAGNPFTPPTPPSGTPGGSGTPPSPPDPTPPPLGVPEPVIHRVSELMPAPVLDAKGFPVDWEPSSTVTGTAGVLQVVVEGVDITYYLGAPIPHPTWSRTEPFGSAAATIQVPQITAFTALPAWCVPGASVDIILVRPGGSTRSRFAGALVGFGHREDDGIFTLEASGVVYLDDLQLRQPAFLTAPRDVGEVIADVLNSTISRRHTDVAPVVTGCPTSVAGGWEPKVTGFIQGLLATAVTGGRQWTVACDERSPIIRLKDTDTVSWTVSNGQRGIQVDLTQDWSQARNVIFGEGIDGDGGRWRNARYPNWHPDDTPPYPGGLSAGMSVGWTDAMTTPAGGISLWQARVGQPVTGVFSQDDRAALMRQQATAGIQVDGLLGPQSWAAAFGTGSNTGTLDCYFAPLAWVTEVVPRLYGPRGDDLGPNPDYNPAVLRVEDKLDFGQGVSKPEGIKGAEDILARSAHPGWVGTVTFEADPEESSRYDVQEGSNGLIRHFRGQALKVHVAQVDYTETTVTATVDTNARDFPTLDAIRERERNATDPARAYQKRLNRGSFTEARATFDAESPAGQVPRFAVFSNLWSVIRIPFGAYGEIVRTELTTTGPATAFAAAVFDRPITAAGLLSIVGNVLTADGNPWSDEGDALDQAGLLMAWGSKNQPAGYYPGEYQNPDGATGSPVTGRLVDDASWTYVSTQSPWLWVAVIAASSCHVEGRFWPGVD